MKTKKGFTLVELLTVMVIFGVIVGLSFPALKTLRERNMDKKFTTYKDAITSGAKLYIESYEDDIFGRNESGCTCIKLKELETKKLAKDISMNDISCDTNNTFVRVTKIDGSYTYSSFLGCKNEETNSIDYIYPKAESAHTYSSEGCTTLCSEEISNGIFIYANPEKDTNYTKSKTIQLYIQSITGINQGMEIFSTWSTSQTGSESLTGYKRLRITTPDNQKDKLAAGQIIQTNPIKIKTPANKSGSYYLHIRVDRLYDLYDAAWSQGAGGKYLVFGPYNIDNEPPTINSHKATSRNSEYNAINPVYNINVTDNVTPADRIKMCLSVDKKEGNVIYNNHLFHKNSAVAKTTTKECEPSKISANKNKYYDFITANMALPAITTYTNSIVKYPIYVNVIDEAGNYTRLDDSYSTSPQYTLTYDSDGGSSCNAKKVIKKNSGTTTWGTLCTPTKTNYTFQGWYSGNTKIDSNSAVTKDLKVTAHWRKNRVIFRVRLLSGESLTAQTTSNGTTHRWTSSGGYVYADGSIYQAAVNYDATTLDLPNYNNTSFLNISKSGYIADPGKEWVCESGCKTSGQKFSHGPISNFRASTICDYSKTDCIVAIKVNWVSAKVYIKINANGGTLATPHGSGYTVSNNVVKYNNNDIIHEFTYNNNIGDSGLINYNNPSYLNLTKAGYLVEPGKEWNTKANGTGTSYSQSTNYKAGSFCTPTSGPCTVTLYVNWKYPYYNNTGARFATLQKAIDGTKNGGTIYLGANWNDGGKAKLSTDKALTFDVNGHTLNLTNDNIEVSKGTFTFKNGTINTTTKDRSAIEITGGTVNILSGITIHCSYVTSEETGTEALRIKGGTVNMSGGTISSGEGAASGYARAVYMTGGTFNMTGGHLYANASKDSGHGGSALNSHNGVVKITGGVLESEMGAIHRCGICANTGSKIKVKNGTTVKVNQHVSSSKSDAVLWSHSGGGTICYEEGVKLTCTGASKCVASSSKITKKANGKC